MSGKWKSHYESARKYISHWEKTFTWVERAYDGSEAAFCKLCQRKIAPKISNLWKHEKTEKHKRRSQDPELQPKRFEDDQEEDGELCLKWHDHHFNFFDQAEQLCAAQKLTDVTLSCGSKRYAAHKLVLSICSGYFAKLFASSTFKDDSRAVAVVYMKDISPKYMELLLKYMYRGEVQISEQDFKEFLEVAEELQVQGLTLDLDIPPTKSNQPSTSNENHSPESKQVKKKRKAPDSNDEDNLHRKETTKIIVSEEGFILYETKKKKTAAKDPFEEVRRNDDKMIDEEEDS